MDYVQYDAQARMDSVWNFDVKEYDTIKVQIGFEEPVNTDYGYTIEFTRKEVSRDVAIGLMGYLAYEDSEERVQSLAENSKNRDYLPCKFQVSKDDVVTIIANGETFPICGVKGLFEELTVDESEEEE